MSHVSIWFYVLLGPIVLAVIAWPAILIVLSDRRPQNARGGAPSDRWATGGMFRGDPRAVSNRHQVPSPHDIPPGDELRPGDALPPEPQEAAQRGARGTDGGGTGSGSGRPR